MWSHSVHPHSRPAVRIAVRGRRDVTLIIGSRARHAHMRQAGKEASQSVSNRLISSGRSCWIQ